MDYLNFGQKDLLLFSNLQEANTAYGLISLICFSELAIFCYTYWGKRHKRDITMWVVIAGWCWGIGSGKTFRDPSWPTWVQNLLFPHFIYYLGIFLIIIGVLIRCLAVLTLGRAFTLSVQTNDDQQLIENGLYAWVRNPAYTGSLISLIGVTFIYRSIFASISVLIICTLCYGARIRVEEKALTTQFGNQFLAYCEKVKYRLLPFIY